MEKQTTEALIAQVQHIAFSAAQDRHTRWVQLSHEISQGDAHLCSDIQRCGRVDLTLLQLEAEFAASLVEGIRMKTNMLADDFRSMLADVWLMQAYEAVRLISERLPDFEACRALKRRLALIRIPMVKGQLANSSRGHGDSHRPTRLYHASNGTAGWRVLDKAGQVHEILRSDLANSFLALAEPQCDIVAT